MLFELGLFFSGWFLSKKGNRQGGDDADGYKPLTDTEMDAELDRIDAERDKK
jgi:hypothetical protein